MFCFSIGLNGQLYLQANVGIENPYNYSYPYNVSPGAPGIQLESQKFRFFRTKIASIGAVYNYNPKFFKKDLILN